MSREFLSNFQRVLVLCPHTDDEFGCAGAVLRFLEAGSDIHYVAMSRCEESVPEGLPSDVLEHECRACARTLGIAADKVEVWPFRVRHFPAARQEILERLVALRREFAPDLVLLPSSFDTHQDHHTVFQEGFRAFKHCTLLGYEMPQNLISFSHSAFLQLQEEHVAGKIEALSCYQSQLFRPYATPEFIRSLARVRGMQCGCEYAEAFELIRLIVT